MRKLDGSIKAGKFFPSRSGTSSATCSPFSPQRLPLIELLLRLAAIPPAGSERSCNKGKTKKG